MKRTHLSYLDVRGRLNEKLRPYRENHSSPLIIYGVPRGGTILAAVMAENYPDCYQFVSHLPCHVIVDDIIDSGRTRDDYRKQFPNVPFVAAVDKTTGRDKDIGWVVFPWEEHLADEDATDPVVRILEHIGENPRREGLLETPERIVRSWKELYSGYDQDPASVLKTFYDGACDEMVLLKDIEFYSMCEHHMLPFSGKAHIAYIPSGMVVGISKLARLLEIFSRRLQIQERIGQQVTAALMEHLRPKGAACVLEAQHLCMTCRGIGKQHSVMVTSSLRGAFLKKPEARAELMGLIR